MVWACGARSVRAGVDPDAATRDAGVDAGALDPCETLADSARAALLRCCPYFSETAADLQAEDVRSTCRALTRNDRIEADPALAADCFDDLERAWADCVEPRLEGRDPPTHPCIQMATGLQGEGEPCAW